VLALVRTLLLGGPRSGGVIATLIAVCAQALVLLVAVDARADDEVARRHFKRGVELYDRKQYDEALAAFQRAYEEKPSAGIKQNIALCLKGLNRPAEAAAAFDEALEEGKGSLKPERRAAIEHELAELSKVVATVTFKVVTDDGRPVDRFTISVASAEGSGPARQLPPGAHRRPLRLMPGIYVFTLDAPGFPSPEPKKLALVSGAPVDVTFVLRTRGQTGKLTVKPSIADAVVRLDGVEVGRGEWTSDVVAGTHRIEVSAPGWKTTTVEVTVPPGGTVEYPIPLEPYAEAPPAYVAPATRPKKVKRMVLVPSLALQSVSYRLGVPLGEPPPHGTRRALGGGSIGGRFGFFFAKSLSAEVFAELGAVDARYRARPSDVSDSRTRVVHFELAPMLRLTLPHDTKVRFTAATGFGLQGRGVRTELARSGTTETKEGRGAGWTWLLDAGVQIEIAPVFLEAALFVDVHGLQSVRDDTDGARFLYASPATRGGLRVGVGFRL